MSLTSSKRLMLSTFKLNTLLAMAQAISSDMEIEDLLERFRKILNDDLSIDRILFYLYEDDEWNLLLSTNCSSTISDKISVERDLLELNEISFVSTSENKVLQKFDIIIPIIQNNATVAFVLIADTKDEAKGVSASIKHLNFVQTLSIIIFVAIENLRLFHKALEQEALKKELELASKMQSLLVPNQKTLPTIPGVNIHAYYQPHSEVGGDFFDVIQLNRGEVGFCIADVSGKGIPAAILMSNFQANLRALFTQEISLTGLIERLNDLVMGTAKGERFITVFIGRYNPIRRTLEYINAGHNPPMYYDEIQNRLTPLAAGCVGLGMVDEIPVIEGELIKIAQPAKLLCYTDGLVEYSTNGEVVLDYSLLETSISNGKSIKDNVEEIVATRHEQVKQKQIEVFDDITILGFDFS